jgi:lipoprotein NlpI
MLLPVLGLLDISFLFYSPVCDRWVYPATLGILALFCAAGTGLFSKCSAVLRVVLVVAAALVVCLFSVVSFDRCGVFHDSETLFRDTITKNPRAWAAYVSLGNLAFDKRELDEAETYYRQALRFKSDYWEAYNGLGIVYAVRGRLDQAISCFTKVLELYPGHSIARRNLSMALKQKEARTSGPEPASVNITDERTDD